MIELSGKDYLNSTTGGLTWNENLADSYREHIRKVNIQIHSASSQRYSGSQRGHRERSRSRSTEPKSKLLTVSQKIHITDLILYIAWKTHLSKAMYKELELNVLLKDKPGMGFGLGFDQLPHPTLMLIQFTKPLQLWDNSLQSKCKAWSRMLTR